MSILALSCTLIPCLALVAFVAYWSGYAKSQEESKQLGAELDAAIDALTSLAFIKQEEMQPYALGLRLLQGGAS